MWMFVTKQWPEQLFENYLANTTLWVFPASRRFFFYFRISIKSSSNQLLRYLLYLMKQKHQTSNQKLFENRLIDIWGKTQGIHEINLVEMPIMFPTEMFPLYQLSRFKFYKNFVCFCRKIFYKLDWSICSSFQY